MARPACELKIHTNKNGGVKQVFSGCKEIEACMNHMNKHGFDICNTQKKNSICYECTEAMPWAYCDGETTPAPETTVATTEPPIPTDPPTTPQGCVPGVLGSDWTGDWQKHDTYKRYWIVDERYPFPYDVTVTKLVFRTGSPDEYSPTRYFNTDNNLYFTLQTPIGAPGAAPYEPQTYLVTKRKNLGNFPEENTFYELDVNFPAQAGQTWGITWTKYGVVSFNWLDRDPNNVEANRNYRGMQVFPGWDSEHTIGWSDVEAQHGHSYRDYAFWVHYC
jgi:hypothetical protein